MQRDLLLPGRHQPGRLVSTQARDSDTPGYAWEVQTLALSPRGLGNGGF